MKKSKKIIAALVIMAVVLGSAGFGAINQAKAQQAKAEPDKSTELKIFVRDEPETEEREESEAVEQTTEYEDDTEPELEDVLETETQEPGEEEKKQEEMGEPEVSEAEPELEERDIPLTGMEKYGYQYDTGYIFLGDSRIYLMNQDCGIAAPGNFFAVCCPGIGYDWMIETGLPKIKNIQSIHSEIKNWVVISALGINDMQNVNKYISSYQKLSKSVDLWLVSINPTMGRTEAQYSNVCIEAFNRRIRKISGITYINSYDYLVKKGFDTKDGVHYTEASNWDIYSYILNSLLVGIDCVPAADTDAKELAQSLEEELSLANY